MRQWLFTLLSAQDFHFPEISLQKARWNDKHVCLDWISNHNLLCISEEWTTRYPSIQLQSHVALPSRHPHLHLDQLHTCWLAYLTENSKAITWDWSYSPTCPAVYNSTCETFHICIHWKDQKQEYTWISNGIAEYIQSQIYFPRCHAQS